MELFDTKLLHANDLFNGVYAVLYFFTEGLCHALTAFTVRFRLAESLPEGPEKIQIFYGDERIRVGLLRGVFSVYLFVKRVVHAKL